MKPPIPNSTSDPVRIELQPLVDRFARAKWIAGLNIVHPEFYSLQFTELGGNRMYQLGEVARPFVACVLEGARRPGMLAWLKLFFRFRLIAGCLQPPAMSRNEINTLIVLAAVYDRERRTA